jgi:hypothetical protein
LPGRLATTGAATPQPLHLRRQSYDGFIFDGLAKHCKLRHRHLCQRRLRNDTQSSPTALRNPRLGGRTPRRKTKHADSFATTRASITQHDDGFATTTASPPRPHAFATTTASPRRRLRHHDHTPSPRRPRRHDDGFATTTASPPRPDDGFASTTASLRSRRRHHDDDCATTTAASPPRRLRHDK